MSGSYKVKVLSFALFLSLALNAGLVSWVAGKKTAFWGNLRGALVDMAQSLPAEERKMAMDVVKAHRPELQKGIEAVREQRKVIRSIVERDNIDQEEMNRAFVELRRRTEKVQEVGHLIAAEIIPQLPVEQRRALVEKQAKMVP